jgi:hypothetical protein
MITTHRGPETQRQDRIFTVPQGVPSKVEGRCVVISVPVY